VSPRIGERRIADQARFFDLGALRIGGREAQRAAETKSTDSKIFSSFLDQLRGFSRRALRIVTTFAQRLGDS
jgi:hypothetical protein